MLRKYLSRFFEADKGAAAGGSTATAETNDSQPSGLPMPSAGSMSRVMEKLGIPSELQEGILEEHSEPQTELEGEQEEEADGEQTGEQTNDESRDGSEEGEQEGETEGEETGQIETDGETDGDEEDEDKPPANATPEWFNKRVGKLTRQRRAAERMRDAAMERAEKAEALLAENSDKSPVVLTPTEDDPLADVTDVSALTTIRAEAENMQDFCRARLNGYLANQGTDKEVWVPADEVARALRLAENTLNKHIPRKEHQLKQQPVFTQQAKALLPDMFKPGTVYNQAYKQVLRDTPWLANDPQRDLKAAVQIIGWQKILDDQRALQKAGKGGAGDKILTARKTNAGLPLTRQNPPAKPRAGVAIPSAKEALAKAEKEMLEQGGNADATREFARKMIRQESQQKNGRQPALV